MAYGAAKRKSSKSVCFIKPGDGKITINGKSLIDYFLDPWQRWRIMRPLIFTKYTCVLDLKIRVRGGGTNG